MQDSALCSIQTYKRMSSTRVATAEDQFDTKACISRSCCLSSLVLVTRGFVVVAKPIQSYQAVVTESWGSVLYIKCYS